MDDVGKLKDGMGHILDIQIKDRKAVDQISDVTASLQNMAHDIQIKIAELVDKSIASNEHVEVIEKGLTIFKEDITKKICELEEKTTSKAKKLLKKAIEEKDPKKALKFIDIAIQSNPTSYCAHCMKAQTLRLIGEYNEALSSIDMAIEFRKDEKGPHAIIYAVKGNILKEQDKYNEAILLYRRAVEIDNEFYFAITEECFCLVQLGKFEEAENKLQELRSNSEIEPKTRIDIDIVQAFLFYKKGQYQEALNLLNELKSREESQHALNLILFDEGIVNYKMENYDSAYNVYRELIEREPEHYPGLFNLGSTLMKLGKAEEAIKAFNEVLKYDPKPECVYCKLGDIYWELEENEKALESHYTEIKTRHKQCFTNWVKLSIIQSELGQYQESLTSLIEARKAKFISPGSIDEANLKIKEGMTVVKMGNTERANVMLNSYLNLYSFEDKSVLNSFAWIYYKINNYKKGELYSRKSVSLDPDYSPALDTLACCLVGLGKTEEALEAFNMALAKGGYDSVTVDVFANLMESIGEIEKAKKIRNQEFFY